MKPQDYPMPLATCPRCGYKPDYASKIHGDGDPTPGDFTICLHCNALLVFTEKMQLRNPTLAESQLAQKDPELRRVIANARAAIEFVHHSRN